MHVSLFLAVRALNDLGIPRFLCLLRGVRIPLVYPRALNGRWAIRANGLRARQIRSTAIPAASIHFEFLPLVDFLLAFTAPATWKHLISITAMRLGNITSSFTSGFDLVWLKLRVRHKSTWHRILQYFVTASLILTPATCRRFYQVFRIWSARVSHVKCTLSVWENDRIYRGGLKISTLKRYNRLLCSNKFT